LLNHYSIMRILTIILFLSLAACGRESSPDGRAQMRDEQLKAELDSVKDQEKAILDSINSINEELKALREKK
jgi:hypothetical protein